MGTSLSSPVPPSVPDSAPVPSPISAAVPKLGGARLEMGQTEMSPCTQNPVVLVGLGDWICRKRLPDFPDSPRRWLDAQARFLALSWGKLSNHGYHHDHAVRMLDRGWQLDQTGILSSWTNSLPDDETLDLTTWLAAGRLPDARGSPGVWLE